MSNAILDHLVEQLAQLPGIGQKSAERLAYHLLKSRREDALRLAEAIRRLKEELRECSRCRNISESELCELCSDDGRDRSTVCVVEQPKDVHAFEQAGSYRGLYYVLGGHFAPMEGRGSTELGMKRLLERIRSEEVEEVILATSPDFEGDGTALFVAEGIRATGVKVSRIARGVPTGSQIEYMNAAILGDALEGRRSFGSAPSSEASQSTNAEDS